jgi:serine/threonine-protein kinase
MMALLAFLLPGMLLAAKAAEAVKPVPAGHGLPPVTTIAAAAGALIAIIIIFLVFRSLGRKKRAIPVLGNLPRKIGNYRIMRPIGRGGMGTVFLARAPEGRRVALKVPEEGAFIKEENRALFKKEAELQMSMKHANIVQILDFNDGSWESVPYIAMEYVEGTSLSEILGRGNPLPIGKAVDILWQILTGLSAAHRLGVTHQDIKPANIIITRKNKVKIMDFGIAADLFSGGKSQSSQSDFMGSPHYMSPEQIGNKPVDYRTDYYSIGVLAYQMLTGKLPFDGDSPIQIATKHLTEAPPEMRFYSPHLPVRLERLVMQLLEKEPDLRPFNLGTIREVLKEIRKKYPE